MSEVLAVLLVVDAVTALFVEEETPVNVVFGWREPPKTINQGDGTANRICFVPGDAGDALGADMPPRYPGRNPRPLATLEELFRVRVWAVDKAAPNSERAQYKATRLLYDATRRALRLCDPGGLKIKSQKWVRSVTERSFGTEIELVCSVDAMVPDLPWQEATDPVGQAGIKMAFPAGDVDPNPGPVVSDDDE